MNLVPLFASATCCAIVSPAVAELPADPVNAFGLDLHRTAVADAPDDNLCLSPYSIELALAMTWAGADGETRAEMARVLHFPVGEEAALHAAFSEMGKSFADPSPKKRTGVLNLIKGKDDGPALLVANRLFGQDGFPFKKPFLELVAGSYGAPLEALDFASEAGRARNHINNWVADQTRDKIEDLIPQGEVGADTRLVLANALYFKAPWAKPFPDRNTNPAPFHARGGAAVDVPTMRQEARYGYAPGDGFTTITLPYRGFPVQFVVWLPDAPDGLASLERSLTAADLAAAAQAPSREVILHLPKFKLSPPSLALADTLKSLGMRRAFDDPPGTADFTKIAEPTAGPPLAIDNVFHKTFLELDEEGTEAAAATAVSISVTSAIPDPATPVEVRVDRPFLFAIQHRPTGTCLFLGRVTDPR